MATLPKTTTITLDLNVNGWICSIHNVSLNPRAKICKLCEREHEKGKLQANDPQWEEHLKKLREGDWYVSPSGKLPDSVIGTPVTTSGNIQIVSTPKEESSWLGATLKDGQIVVPICDPSMKPTFSEYLLKEVRQELLQQESTFQVAWMENTINLYFSGEAEGNGTIGTLKKTYQQFLNSKDQENIDTFSDYLLYQALPVLETFPNKMRGALAAYFGDDSTVYNILLDGMKTSYNAMLQEKETTPEIEYGQMVKLLPPHEYAGVTGIYVRDELQPEGQVKMFEINVSPYPNMQFDSKASMQVPALEGEYELVRETEADGFSVTGA
jgi:hypothetical protein